jgi:DNA (cytosine-5)-methyltransferase 1
MDAKPLTFGSLFAGVDGFGLGFERAGMVCKWQVELNPLCQQVLAKHWPTVRRHDDVRTFPPTDADDWRVDVICGGPPCQPASDAGLQRGDQDERWMWGEALRVVRLLRPRFIVMENPTGLLRLGREFGVIVSGLAGDGRVCEWGVLSSAGMGANHQRKRVLILSYPDCGDASEERPAMGRQRRFLCAGDATKVHVIRRNQTEQEPGIPRVADGLPNQIHRNRMMGNSIDPRVAERIGRRLMEATQ